MQVVDWKSEVGKPGQFGCKASQQRLEIRCRNRVHDEEGGEVRNSVGNMAGFPTCPSPHWLPSSYEVTTTKARAHELLTAKCSLESGHNGRLSRLYHSMHWISGCRGDECERRDGLSWKCRSRQRWPREDAVWSRVTEVVRLLDPLLSDLLGTVERPERCGERSMGGRNPLSEQHYSMLVDCRVRQESRGGS